MRREFAAFRLEPDALHQAFVFCLHIEQGLCRGDTGYDRASLAAAERGQPLHVQFESAAFYAPEHGRNLVCDVVIDVADEPQGQVIIFGIDPAGAGQPAAQGRQRLSDIRRNLNTCEETRHDQTSSHGARAARALTISSSTRGRIRSTIMSTPAAVGCRPSACFNVESAAYPSRKTGYK